jgi:mRNA interferase RelE/StbE
LNNYTVILMPQAQKDLNVYSGKLLSRFEKIILGLYSEPRPRKAKKLSGGSSRWRIKTGDYRILYEIDDAMKIVNVYRVIHRKDAYR